MFKKIILPLSITVLFFVLFTNFKTTSSEKVDRISNNIKCVECQGLSIAQSSSTVSKGLVEEIKNQVNKGKSEKEIYNYIAEKYGDDIILTPQDGSAKVFLFYLTIAVFIIFILLLFRKKSSQITDFSSSKNYVILSILLCSIIGLIVYTITHSNSNSKLPTKTTTTSLINSENAFLNAIKQNPNSADLYYNYALFLLNKKRYSLSLIQLDKTVQLDASRADAQALSGWVVFLAGLPTNAIDRLNKAVNIDADYADSYFYLSMCYNYLQNKEKAKENATLFLEKLGNNTSDFKDAAIQIINS